MASRDDAYINSVAGLLKKHREQLGLTQQDVASKSGMTIFSYNRIENGKVDIRLSTLTAIAKALDLHDPTIIFEK